MHHILSHYHAFALAVGISWIPIYPPQRTTNHDLGYQSSAISVRRPSPSCPDPGGEGACHSSTVSPSIRTLHLLDLSHLLPLVVPNASPRSMLSLTRSESPKGHVPGGSHLWLYLASRCSVNICGIKRKWWYHLKDIKTTWKRRQILKPLSTLSQRIFNSESQALSPRPAVSDITWEPGRNANFQVPSQTYSTKNSDIRALTVSYKLLRWYQCSLLRTSALGN